MIIRAEKRVHDNKEWIIRNKHLKEARNEIKYGPQLFKPHNENEMEITGITIN